MVAQVCRLLLCLQKLSVFFQALTCAFPMISEFAAILQELRQINFSLTCIVQDTVLCTTVLYYAYRYKPASLTVSQTMTLVS